jgi:SNF2 family DNA or RNA helicase
MCLDIISISFFLFVGGVGLNLVAANIVVIFDPNWNPAAE